MHKIARSQICTRKQNYIGRQANIFSVFIFFFILYFLLSCKNVTRAKYTLGASRLRAILFSRAILCPRANLASCNFVLVQYSPLLQFSNLVQFCLRTIQTRSHIINVYTVYKYFFRKGRKYSCFVNCIQIIRNTELQYL